MAVCLEYEDIQMKPGMRHCVIVKMRRSDWLDSILAVIRSPPRRFRRHIRAQQRRKHTLYLIRVFIDYLQWESEL